MRSASLLSVLAILGLAASARADLFVHAPFLNIHIGQPAPPVVVYPANPPLPEPLIGAPIPVGPAAVLRPPTLEEFAESFHPAAGHYEVVLLNPETCCATKVCFTLPCGCPTVRVHEKSLVFHYGLLDNVSIRFHHDGSVTVKD
jgi:hypothetical protein